MDEYLVRLVSKFGTVRWGVENFRTYNALLPDNLFAERWEEDLQGLEGLIDSIQFEIDEMLSDMRLLNERIKYVE